MRVLILILGLLLALPPAPAEPALDTREKAEALVEEKDWAAAREILEAYLARTAGDPRSHELLGLSLSALDENDLAAHHLAAALELYQEAGNKRGASNAQRALGKVDSLQSKRAALEKDATSKLYKAAEKLFEQGHPDRARDILERLRPIFSGKNALDARRLLEKVRSSSEEVNLDEAGEDGAQDKIWPLVTFESDHYIMKANLEQDLVELVAETMDDIHGYYVQLYFDGDAKAAKSTKATIRIHPNKESMIAGWSGASAPEGWWSPGENQVTCYDTRTSTGSLEWMLETLFHEASHQFMSLLERRGGSSPAWLNEGTASFFEGAIAMADHRVLWPDAAIKRLQNLVSMLNGSADSPTLEQVVGYSGAGSYPGNYYAWGWGIVYFMQQYEDPESLEYAYRPLYSDYRERITKGGRSSMELFEEIFLGQSSPLGHQTLDDFKRDWREWILEMVAPLHISPKDERRSLRLALVHRYSEAAREAAENKKALVEEIELLARALGHIEYIRDKIDGEDFDDVALLAQQADIFELLERPAAAAPLVQRLLQLADEEAWSPSSEEFADLEKRLQRLDRRNYSLRRAENTRKLLLRSAHGLFERYQESKEPMPLRAYTFASRMGAALSDTEVLLTAASELREEIRERGLLMGRVHTLTAPAKDWITIYTTKPDSFRSTDGRVELSSVRPNGRLNTTVEVGDEYQIRATIVRSKKLHRSTCNGLVIAGVREGDWLVFGLLKSGKAGLWRLLLSPGGGVTTKKIETFYLRPAPPDDRDLDVSVQVSDGRFVEIRVGDCDPIETVIPEDMPRGRFAGIYAKDGKTVLLNPVLELY